MIFQHTWERVIRKIKTQTRRLVQPTDQPYWDGDEKIIMIVSEKPGQSNRIRWQVGKTYAVQPGRGKPALMVHYTHPCLDIDIWAGADPISDYSIALSQGYQEARVKLVQIRQEHLQDITEADAIAEGVEHNWLGDDCPPEYADEWANYLGGDEDFPCYSARESYFTLWDSFHNRPGERVEDNPEVWVLEFELALKNGGDK